MRNEQIFTKLIFYLTEIKSLIQNNLTRIQINTNFIKTYIYFNYLTRSTQDLNILNYDQRKF